jgi:uncharacterized alkaline shock family protein YloU
MSNEMTSLGSIHVSPRAIATIAFHAARSSYGVVGLTSKNIVNTLTKALVKDPTHGVEVHYDGKEITIDLYIVIEYGTNVKTVAESVTNTVGYQVERALGMPVKNVNVHVQGLRISDLD